MSKRVTSVSDALDLLVPTLEDDAGDWGDILDRAGVGGAHSARRKLGPRHTRWLIAALAVLALLASAPAWSGAGYGRVVHFLAGRPPKEVTQDLARMDEDAPPGLSIRPLPGKTKKVYERRTPFGVFRIWLTPTKTGLVCETIEGQAGGRVRPLSGGCMSKVPRAPIEVSGTGGGTDFVRGFLEGRVGAKISSLELRYVNGERESVPVQNGFFLTVVDPLRMTRFGDHPLSLTGRDSDGRVVRIEPLDRFYDSPSGGPGRPPVAVVKRERLSERVSIGSGQTAYLYLSPSREGGLCARVRAVGANWSWTCSDARRLHWPLRVGLSRIRTRTGPAILVYGVLKAGLQLEFRFEDETVRRVPLRDQNFLESLPRGSWQPGRRLAEMVVSDDGRDVLKVPVARKGHAFYTGSVDRAPESSVVRPRKPPRPSATLRGRIRRGRAVGVAVEASESGPVVFRVSRSAPAWKLLAGTNVSYACFRIRHAGAPWDVRDFGVLYSFARAAEISIWGPRPFDGCEIQGSFGHRWRDRYGTHSAAEVPFNARARRFFADRAVARDLALFVRSHEMQMIRRQRGGELRRALTARFGSSLVVLRRRDGRPPVGRIGYWISGADVRFVELEGNGARFFVDVRRGRILGSNFRGLAFVF